MQLDEKKVVNSDSDKSYREKQTNEISKIIKEFEEVRAVLKENNGMIPQKEYQRLYSIMV